MENSSNSASTFPGGPLLVTCRSDPPRQQHSNRWIAFLHNHADGIAAMDFFTVPTATFQIFYVWFVIRHARRDVVHFAVTEHPHSGWVIQQLREAFPFESAAKYLIFDGDAKFRGRVERAVADFGIKGKRTAPRSPWQNPIAERWVGSCRRELLVEVVVLNKRHLTRLLNDYTSYYRLDRTHLSLQKDAPAGRPINHRPRRIAKVVALPRVGGLHHRYEWGEAA